MNVAHAMMQDAQDAQHDVELFEIGCQMKMAQFSDEFIAAAIRTALEFEGVADLVRLWAHENDTAEKNEIIADIQEMIDACSATEKTEHKAVRLNDLEAIAKNIRGFKDALLDIVLQQGGVTQLAILTGIPQPSLSRFFNSNSMPQRSTLLKISKALNIDIVKLESQWID